MERGTHGRQRRQAHVDAKRRQGDEKAQQQVESHGGRRNAHGQGIPWLRNRSAAAANNELAINRGILLADMLEIAGVLRWNVACMRLAVANRRATDQSRRFHQRRGRGRACGPSKGCRASDGLRNCYAIAELSQQHNYSDQVSHDSISPVWDTFSRRGPARDRRRPQGIMFSPTRLHADHFRHRDFRQLTDFHMTNIMQFGFIYISQSNCLVTVEIEMGSVPVNRRGSRRRSAS